MSLSYSYAVRLIVYHYILYNYIFVQSILNHMCWVAISSSSPKEKEEKEEKWLTLLNHIANVHVHENNELFKVCTHELIERQWLKKGNSAHVLCRLIFFFIYLCIFYTYTNIHDKNTTWAVYEYKIWIV